MLRFLQRILSKLVDNRSDLERYIVSRRPQTAGEIDQLVKQWQAGGRI
jgi:hypothetical protein